MRAMTEARSFPPPPDGQRSRDEVQLELRASDADRDAAAGVLGNALATGRLTSTEHAERLDAVYAAKTVGDLAPLTRDLPAEAAAASVGVADRAEVSARFSKVIRSGRWVAGRRTRLTARFGALIVDLSDAVLPGREITLEINAFCGKDGGDADGPVIRLVGDARFAKVAVHRGRYDPRDARQQWLPAAVRDAKDAG